MPSIPFARMQNVLWNRTALRKAGIVLVMATAFHRMVKYWQGHPKQTLKWLI